MNIKTITKAAAAVALAVIAFASCNKNHRHEPDRTPEEQVTAGLSVAATYFGDYYGKGFQDYILLFQIGEKDEEGYFKKSGVELSLDVLTATGGPTLFPEGIYEITDDKYNSAGIIPSIEQEDDEGNTVYGDTYLYTQQDADNYWLEPLKSAHLEVSVDGAQYTIKIKVEVGREEYTYLYKGALAIEDKSSEIDPGEDGPEGDYDFKADSATAFNLGHEWGDDTDDWMIYLEKANTESEWVCIEVVAETGSNPEVLPTGNFVVPADFLEVDDYVVPAGTLCPLYQFGEDYYGTFYVFDDTIWYSATSGSAKISKSGNNYTISLSFRDEEYDGAKLTSTYTGTVDIDVSEYYDGTVSLPRVKKAAPSYRRPAAMRSTTTTKRNTKAACKLAGRLS